MLIRLFTLARCQTLQLWKRNTAAMNYDYSWYPFDIENGKIKFLFGKYALMILNRNITINPLYMSQLWDNAILRLTIDGGTDRWLNYVKDNNILVKNKYPDIISGDLDSINPETLDRCKKIGIKIEHTPDQDYTDTTKGFQVIHKHMQQENLDSVLIISEWSGRLDHIFSNINSFHYGHKIFKEKRTKCYYLNDSVTWLLQSGKHLITIPKQLRDNSEICGILPFASKQTNVTTSGLKWNINNQSIEFGGLISSSNTYDKESLSVIIETDGPIIWTMSVGFDMINNVNIKHKF